MDTPDIRPLTFTRVIPDHYDTNIKSPSRLLDVRKRRFPFMFLPVELRIQVYQIYLTDRYTLSPTEIHEMVLNSRHRTKRSPEILRVSKTVNAEVRHLLQQEKTITLRICWQDATLDGFAMSCLQSRGMRRDYDHIAHLRVEIYPRHPDRPTDIVCIWKYVQSLCSDLKEASCVQKLSLHFMENEYAKWSLCGLPLETFECLHFIQMQYAGWYAGDGPGAPYIGGWDKDRKPWDLLHILNLFGLLKNVKEAHIHLPLSVTDNVRLQEARKYTEEVMMQTTSLDDKHQRLVIDTIQRAIADREELFEFCTSSRAQEKLDSLFGEACFLLKHHLGIFEKVWPNRECADWNDILPSHYIDIEGIEGEPIEYDDASVSEYTLEY